MWSPDDEQRYEGLTLTVQRMLAQAVPVAGDLAVPPEDLALYLEWFELAREGAPSVRPFLDKSSPYTLSGVSYRQLATDFQWLNRHLQPIAA